MEKKSEKAENPAVSVDIVLLTVIDNKLQVALTESKSTYLHGQLALVGGTVHPDEDDTLDDTVQRILASRGGLRGIFVEQLFSFGGRARDPRGWSVSVAYYGLLPISKLEKNEDHLTFYPVSELPDLPFDHNQIVDTAVQRVRGKGGYSTIPARLLDKRFSMPQMRNIYSAVLGQELDPSSFRRKVLSLGIVKSTNKKSRVGDGDRPSEMFELKPGVINFDNRL